MPLDEGTVDRIRTNLKEDFPEANDGIKVVARRLEPRLAGHELVEGLFLKLTGLQLVQGEVGALGAGDGAEGYRNDDDAQRGKKLAKNAFH
jgi:hypothetical protein